MAVEKKLQLSLTEFQSRIQQFQQWVGKQALPIEASITTVTGAVAGAINGVLMDVVFKKACPVFSLEYPPSLDHELLAGFGGYQKLVKSFLVGSRLEQARNFAVVYAANAGISCVMKKVRGKEDVHTSMVAGFGTGILLSLVTGMKGPEVVSVGLVFALANGGYCKLGDNLSKPKAEDLSHDETRGMFGSIGFGFDDRKDAKREGRGRG